VETLNYAQQYLQQYSYLGVVILILVFSFVLPLSKTLVIVGAGVLTSQGYGNGYLYFTIALASMLFADVVYYYLGRLLGVRILQWSLFKGRRRQFNLANERFRHHAWLTILSSRFLPYIRIFIYIIAGIDRMPLPLFLSADFIATFVYTLAAIYLGYRLAENRQLLVEYVDEAEIYIGAVAIVTLAWVMYRHRRQRHKLSH